MADNNLFGIIGLGRFGLALAEGLKNNEKTIIAIDKDPSKLTPLKTTVNQLLTLQELSRESLRDAGIAECGTVVVCIGKDIEANILATLNAIELGVPRVFAKAISDDHSRILEKIGAKVINPEIEMGTKLAKTLSAKLTLDVLPIGEDFSIIEIQSNERYAGQTVQELNFRQKFNVNIVAIVRAGKAHGNIGPATKLEKDDILVLSGNNKHISDFETKNSK
ncbi:MAG: TrkA family potassium uptake protein [Spirochaetaceae bacterium]|nr:TrkA family potassium uptake protein [Spirochaetaceae bacterium]